MGRLVHMRDYKRRLEQAKQAPTADADPWVEQYQIETISERALLARFCFGVVFGFVSVYLLIAFTLSI
jgi:hypothetical protein